MATKVIVRLATFIRAPWVHDPTDLPGGDYSEFQGDNRGFTPYTGASETYYKRYRTWQEFEIDFSTGSMTYREDMGQTVNRITKTDGTVTTKYGIAPLSGISFANVQWGQHSVQFDAIVDASNPLVTAAPAINYDFHISIWDNGQVQIQGAHDGFPDYEVYKKVDGGAWKTVYQFDAEAHGNSLMNLFPPEDVTGVNRIVA